MIERCPDTRRRPAYIAMVDAGYDRETIADQILTLLLAGHETTANTLAWNWISLLRTPPYISGGYINYIRSPNRQA